VFLAGSLISPLSSISTYRDRASRMISHTHAQRKKEMMAGFPAIVVLNGNDDGGRAGEVPGSQQAEELRSILI
jgi:hypothetical protein